MILLKMVIGHQKLYKSKLNWSLNYKTLGKQDTMGFQALEPHLPQQPSFEF